MKIIRKVVAVAALVSATVFAGAASAQSYNLNFGNSLTAQISTAPSTGANRTITGITGSFMGQTITGLITNPYSPAIAYFNDVTGKTSSNNPNPTLDYTFDNLIGANGIIDDYGIMFTTAADDVNLFNDGAFELSSNVKGSSVVSNLAVKGSITPIAAAVPEPAAWLMMILGMGAVGFAMRRQRSEKTTVRFA